MFFMCVFTQLTATQPTALTLSSPLHQRVRMCLCRVWVCVQLKQSPEGQERSVDFNIIFYNFKLNWSITLESKVIFICPFIATDQQNESVLYWLRAIYLSVFKPVSSHTMLRWLQSRYTQEGIAFYNIVVLRRCRASFKELQKMCCCRTVDHFAV